MLEKVKAERMVLVEWLAIYVLTAMVHLTGVHLWIRTFSIFRADSIIQRIPRHTINLQP